MKNITVIAVARRIADGLSRLEADYCKRCVLFNLQTVFIKPSAAKKESAAIIKKIPPQAVVLLLDENGEQKTAPMFAKFISQQLQKTDNIAFIIGGATGHSPPVLQTAHYRLSLSPLTFSHRTARLALTEQLFRADCTLRGHPYPK